MKCARPSKQRVVWMLFLLAAVALVFGMRMLGQPGKSPIFLRVTTRPDPPVVHTPPALVREFEKEKNDVQVFVPIDGQTCKFQARFSVPGNHVTKLCTYDPAVDRMISGQISRSGMWEGELISLMLDLMKKHSSDLSLVDVGSNIGVFTMSAAVSGYRVLAMDAMNSSLQLLATSLRLANVESRVTILHNAISDKHENVAMQVYPDNIGGSFVVRLGKEGAKAGSTVPKTDVVKAVCLDDVVPYVATRRVFVKMDIETSEWLALQCADKFFAELDVLYLMMEWMWYRKHSRQGNVVINFMTSHGYRPFMTYRISSPLSLATNSTWPDNVIWIKE